MSVPQDEEWMRLLGGANILQIKVESRVPLSDFALLCSVGRAVELKSKLKLHRKQILGIDFNTGEHFKLAKSFTAARGGNPISTCLFQSLPFVYTSAIHVVMQKKPSLGTDIYLFCQVSCNWDQFPEQPHEPFFWLK